MRVLMIVMSDVLGDIRVRREAESLSSAGYEVTIIGDRPAADRTPPLNGVAVRFAREPRPQAAARSRLTSAPRWLLLPWHRRRQLQAFQTRAVEVASRLPPPHVVHAHDLSALPLATEIARRTSADLVYDAHECWAGRKLAGRPTPILRWFERRREQQLGGLASAVITVSDGIADWLRDRYGWSNVQVIRNSFPSKPYVSPRSASGLLYAGRIDEKRDLETLARAKSRLSGLEVTAIGPDSGAGASLRGRLELRSPVPADDLDAMYRDHGLALIPLAPGSLNHELALPNKLFQAVRSGVPVVAADLGELRRLVTYYDIGTLYRPGSINSLVRAVGEAVSRFDELVANVASAREQLSWEHDERRLLEIYADLAKDS